MTRKPVIGVHPDRVGQESYSDKWAEFLRDLGAEVRILNLLAPNAFWRARPINR